ncbi:MAG TPA: TonB-dependent receptor [Vicinamibacterales bacterium]|nr:TonB-dependent receptor [Vicinamibacterales bacterium]
MRRLSAACIVAGLCVLVPSAAFAQGVLTGVVKDASGAVLPGVTVEASSPDLIERVRTAVTDSGGQYRIVDLRAGSYTVSFTLQGFTTVRREGIAIEGTFTATVNVDLRVGTVAESVTVSGETPIVDVQSVKRQTVIDNEMITAIPAARSYAGLMTLMPGTVTQGGAASDTQVVPGMVVFGGAGGRSNEGRLQVDGLSVGSAFNGAGVSAYIADVGNAQEVVLTASGGLGETEVGGPTLNIVPKEGGNTFRGSAYASGVSERMVDSNYTQELKDRGLTTPGKYQQVWDLNLGVGGPLFKDRLWFFGQIRDEGSYRTIPGMFANLNMGDPTKWTYVVDPTRPAVAAASFRTTALRLTGQASKNKFSVFWDEQKPCEGAALVPDANACRHSEPNEIIAGGASPTPTASAMAAPETAAYRDYGQRVQQARWTNPLTNKLLLESSAGTYQSRWGGKEMPGANTDLVRVTEQCSTGQTAPGTACEHGISNLVYRAPNWSSNKQLSVNWKASASYVLGSQNAKLGYQGSYLSDNRTNFSSGDFVAYRFNNGLPNQITQSVNRFTTKQRVETHSLYAQDTWTLGRVTLIGALRYDRASSFFPEQTVGPVRFLPMEVFFPRTNGVDAYHDLTPRGGVAWDMFGDGKTSLKVNVGKYLEAAQNGGLFTALNPTSRLATTATRNWNDRMFAVGDPRRDNFVPDCDLLDSALNGECGLSSVTNFGTLNPEQNLDPSLVSGWGNRSYDWQTGVAVQRQIVPRVSVEVGYQRRWLGNFVITDNRARNPEDGDFTIFGVNVPADSRLPDGGGYVLDGLYNVTPTAAARATDNLVTLSKGYGGQSQVSHALNINSTARSTFGLVVQGGVNYAVTNTERCDIRAAVPEYSVILSTTTSPTQPWCDFSQHLLRFTALGSYNIPKIDVQVAGTFRSDQGDELAASFTFGQSDTVGLNRALAGGSATAVVNLVEPGTLYGDRVNQFDFRLAKILRFGGTRTNIGIDVYNVFNTNPVLTYNAAFVPNQAVNTWLRPNSVLTPRFAKFSVQFDF